MRRDSRLSRVLHVLLHLARHEGPMTSEAIARMLNTNAVVVRRTMAGLREVGFVRSEKGHGGGWTLSCDLARISLLDLHLALGEPVLFAIGHADDSPGCLVEQAVNRALGSALSEAEALLRTTLAGVTLADLSADFERRLSEQPASNKKESFHAA